MAQYLEKVLSKAKSRNPHELCTKCQVALERLGDSASDKQQEEVGKYLAMMKVRLLVAACCLQTQMRGCARTHAGTHARTHTHTHTQTHTHTHPPTHTHTQCMLYAALSAGGALW